MKLELLQLGFRHVVGISKLLKRLKLAVSSKSSAHRQHWKDLRIARLLTLPHKMTVPEMETSLSLSGVQMEPIEGLMKGLGGFLSRRSTGIGEFSRKF